MTNLWKIALVNIFKRQQTTFREHLQNISILLWVHALFARRLLLFVLDMLSKADRYIVCSQ